ncbi:MBL fold metallo-hydrolase [Lactococcus lactis]|uniref:MBL fold metallo-hydrolase n=1 Tax=Lactococcus lactis TaxID=1358 RepID=UPI00241854BD|nr:MBL fold metallo-hydrolase [Lactococcus lactis]MDG4967163.1 MBL fold metallo-hydrolase [Lactococcus lactis]
MAGKYTDVIRISESIYVFSNSEGDVNADVPGTVVPINFWAVVNKEKEVFIIDTGFDDLAESVLGYVESLGTPTAIFATHGHLDHVLGVKVYKKAWNIPAFIDYREIEALKKGIPPYPSKTESLADFYEPLSEEMLKRAGLKSYYVPGHSVGNTIYYHEDENIMLAGDMISNSEDMVLPPAYRYTLNMDQAIDSAKILDVLKPEYISTGHGKVPFMKYKEGMYRDMYWGFASKQK